MKQTTIKVRARVDCPRCRGAHEPFVEVAITEVERALAALREAEYQNWQAEQLQLRTEERAVRQARSVYVIRNPRSGLVKIGVAGDVQGRLKALERAAGEPLDLVATIGTGTVLEADLHRQFAAARRIGEWFDASEPELAAWLASLSVPA